MMTLTQQAAAAWVTLRQRRGIITNIAHGLGIQPQAVWQWQMVPLHRLHDVARIAGVSWRELRPDFAKAARRPRNGGGSKRKTGAPYTQALRTQSSRKRRHGKGPDKSKHKVALKTKRGAVSTVPRM